MSDECLACGPPEELVKCPSCWSLSRFLVVGLGNVFCLMCHATIEAPQERNLSVEFDEDGIPRATIWLRGEWLVEPPSPTHGGD